VNERSSKATNLGEVDRVRDGMEATRQGDDEADLDKGENGWGFDRTTDKS